MIVALSYVIAVILTFLLAVVLYPVAALFWLLEQAGHILVLLFDLFGKLSDSMFNFTTRVIRYLWKDIKNMEQQHNILTPAAQWKCSCGAMSTGKFCVECGNPAPKAEASSEQSVSTEESTTDVKKESDTTAETTITTNTDKK